MELKLINSKSYLYELFSDSWQQVLKLQSIDEEFKSMCDDYEACMQVINRNSPAKALSSELVKEYKELCSSLESEITYYLKARSTKIDSTNTGSAHQKSSKNEELKNV